jgi:hypothetical protein
MVPLGVPSDVARARMRQAAVQLTTTSLPVKAIGAACGYPAPYHFSRASSVTVGSVRPPIGCLRVEAACGSRKPIFGRALSRTGIPACLAEPRGEGRAGMPDLLPVAAGCGAARGAAYAAFTSMVRGLLSARRGRVTVSTPLLTRAVIAAVSMLSSSARRR